MPTTARAAASVCSAPGVKGRPTTEAWDGTSEGSYVADVALSNARLGPEPVPHLLGLRRSFPAASDEIAPRDHDGGNEPFESAPIWGR